jgi:glycosyltransferase involved in cell wall biosynthesis
MEKQPTVSVCMITYGHEKFIEQSINSVLMQQVDFEIELIVSNDCSPDTTDLVVQNILKNHPRSSQIRYIKHLKNIGMIANSILTIKECRGKYIALCEGDDYWIDSLKLQKQVDFLENNLDYNFSMGKVYKYYEDTKKRIFNDSVKPSLKETYLLKDYLKGKFSQTSSFLMRNDFGFPDWFFKVHAGDQSIVILATKDKKIKYHNDFFSVYRINSESVSFTTNHKIAFEKSIFFLNSINKHTNFKFQNIIELRKLNNFLFYKMKQINNPIFDVIFKVIMRTNNYLVRFFL